MIGFTVSEKTDPDLAGVPAVVLGVDPETKQIVLMFRDDSRIMIPPTDLRLLQPK